MRILMIAAVIGICLTAAHPSRGAIVVGGPTPLLTQAYANQLETWLGQGAVTLTRIYEKQSGDDSSDFHAAVDGQGPTITLVEVLEGVYPGRKPGDVFDPNLTTPHQIIGGYNPRSWDASINSYNITLNDPDRTAFVFNLTSTEIQRQNLTGDGDSYGEYQTYNYSGYGPTFGGGHDLHVAGNLSTGYARNLSYGGTTLVDNILMYPSASGNVYLTQGLAFGDLEVFSISVTPAGEVPEAGSIVIWGVLGLTVSAYAWRRKRQGATSGVASALPAKPLREIS